ncbi:hypothetical protein JII91_29885 (plasmid) [Klebsiella quasipneumoniae]|uniref:hypothetical protein n=1 Tax=Klebsiella quasipneumoniae TaxID=1463165 RepID=UPI0019155481|nr:hypothetical protein [Klebsiella quasipneumoniae]QQM83499.1 hypothetical protein JII91_29885 [Klebsiella quasipneumoniae]
MATHKPINILEAFAAPPPPLDYVLPNMGEGGQIPHCQSNLAFDQSKFTFDFPLQADQQHCTVSTTLDALTRSPRGTDSTLFAVSVARGHQAAR